MKIVSWNVNGIVACRRRGFLKFLADSNADVVCCQEVKTQVPLSTPGYTQFWFPAKRPGYSGTLVLTKRTPLSVAHGFDVEKFDDEGRFIILGYEHFYICNIYSPSTWSSRDRLDYRIEWDAALLERIKKLDKPAILCGDFNTAHRTIDTYPENIRNKPQLPDFSVEERYGMDQILDAGFVDVFRTFYPEKEGAYTWWSSKPKCREENRGSRLDYFLVSPQLLSSVRSIRHHIGTDGADHCPISLTLQSVAKRQEPISNQIKSAMWQTVDWPTMENQLFSMQKELAYAAYMREWEQVEKLQKDIVGSWAAKVLAVRAVAAKDTAAGVDGVKLDSNEKKIEMALSLTPNGYRPMPYRHKEVDEGIRTRVIHIPTARDKAMQVLYAYTLDPVAEALADKKSFSARKGRSGLDLHAYLQQALTKEDAPGWAVIVDVKGYYASIIHQKLLDVVPMDKAVLRKFLRAGVVRAGEFFATEQGISLGTSLSPILGNLLLDGLQSYIYDRLYPKGNVDYPDGELYRFADDMIVLARSQSRAEQVMEIITEFLSDRGLRLNHEKSFITSLSVGFDFLARSYKKKNGILAVAPTGGSIKRCEKELEALILDFQGPLRKLIEEINNKLTGWANYHRVTDAYMVFRHIDAVVTGLLVKRMCVRHPRWHRKTILDKYWVKDGLAHIFVLPDDPSVRVLRLAPISIVRHKPCKLSFNPYLDGEYYQWLQGRHNIQKASGKYKTIWQRQDGKCAYCGLDMLPDQEVEVIEKHIGQGWRSQNLAYIHRQCAYDIFNYSDECLGDPLDLFSMLEGIMDEAPKEDSPYLELTEFFRLTEQTPITLTFREIEEILGDRLDWEAYFYEAFWYDDIPGRMMVLWKEENFPFDYFLPTTPGYCIADSWLSQGYRIKALHLSGERVVFRRSSQGQEKSGLVVPSKLINQKLPNNAIHEARKFFSYLIKKYGL